MHSSLRLVSRVLLRSRLLLLSLSFSLAVSMCVSDEGCKEGKGDVNDESEMKSVQLLSLVASPALELRTDARGASRIRRQRQAAVHLSAASYPLCISLRSPPTVLLSLQRLRNQAGNTSLAGGNKRLHSILSAFLSTRKIEH